MNEMHQLANYLTDKKKHVNQKYANKIKLKFAIIKDINNEYSIL